MSFAALRASFLSRVPVRLEKLQSLLAQIQQASVSEQTQLVRDLHREAHNLTGASGSYQCQALSQSSRQLERLVSAWLNQLEAEAFLLPEDLEQNLHHLLQQIEQDWSLTLQESES
ncbi:Hpt domain-containing protein [Nitrincola tapanii]|nr:Hpt domain-containing protein [Nitrincola tapanii]